MLKDTLLQSVKQHPVAIIIYSIYMAIWLFICYLTYYYLVHANSETIQAILFYWFMCVCIPYLTINIILSYQAKTDREFYKSMAGFIFLPMGLALLVLAEDAALGYFNKGV